MVKLKTGAPVKFDKVAKLIRQLYRQHGGTLHPADIVEAARDPASPLHRMFNWDDSTAADEYRLWQARKLIARVRVSVPVTPTKTITVRAYHALRSERGGYRHTRDIISDADLRESLLSQLADDLAGVRERYSMVAKVAEAKKVFSAIEEFVGARKAAKTA